MTTVLDYLSEAEDSRDPKKIIYPLPTLLFISICGVFSGAQCWEDIIVWAETKKDWLAKYVDMSCGIPSYSTIRRIFISLSSTYFGYLLKKNFWSNTEEVKSEDHIAIDGKTLRGSKCKSKDVRAIQMVSALSVENNIIIGEVKTDSKSNEIKAIPLLLALIELEGATVSIDAMGCNETIIQEILKRQANYVIGLKKNQPTLYSEVEKYCKDQTQGTALSNLVKDGMENSHGRQTRRRYFAIDATEKMKELGFSEMNTVIATETISSSTVDGSSKEVSAEWRYYVTNHDKTHPQLADYIRGHWLIESRHWLLDVHLNDDNDKKYDKYAAQNFAKVRRFLLDLVQSNPPEGKKRSIRSNLKRVGWDSDYIVKLLFS